MKVSVVINTRAGRASAQAEAIERKVRRSLFRCELEFLRPGTTVEMQTTLVERVRGGTDFLMVCGGDGTLNVAIQPLMQLRMRGIALPPLCPIPVGTANDLAKELQISTRIDEAARNILEGCVKTIDVIEIEAEGKTAYMLTNGGLGVPAETAARANRFRSWVQQRADCEDTRPYLKPIFKAGSHLIQKAGDRIYEIMLAGVITRWDKGSWKVEIELPSGHTFTSHAPFIMINNQRVLGGRYTPAPLTRNSDGTFNVLLVDSNELLVQTRSLLQIRSGRIPNEERCPNFETTQLLVRSLERPLTFFGDGEILHQNARELRVRCIHPGLPVVIRESK